MSNVQPSSLVSSANVSLWQCLGISAASLITGLFIGKAYLHCHSSSASKHSNRRLLKKQKTAANKSSKNKANFTNSSSNNHSSETSVTPISSTEYTEADDDDETSSSEENDEEEYESSEEEEEEDDLEVESLALNDIPGEVRMVFVIRTDLAMTKGKIAAQCCHAAVANYKKIATVGKTSANLQLLNRWERGGQAKITLKCPSGATGSAEELDMLYAKAISLGINSTIIHDAGRTQIAAGSATVLGLGPAPKSVIDQVTGALKLY